MQAPPVEDPPAPSLVDPSLAELRERIDATLASLARDRSDTRRTVTRHLGIEPRPEELEAIARIAAGAGGGPIRELACTALALRVLAERGTRELFEQAEFSRESIGRAALLVSGLLDTVDTFQTEVKERLDGLDPRERDHVLEVVDPLLPEAEPLIAGAVLAPRLLELVSAAESGDPRAIVPQLTDADLASLAAAARSQPADQDGTGRLGVNAIAMRTVIADDLAAWERSGRSDEQALNRMKRDRAAYRFVAHALQRRQDTALLAGLAGFAARLRQEQRELFSTYLRLTAALNQGTRPASGETGTAPAAAADLDRLLRACHLSEAVAESRREVAVPNEKIYADALRVVHGAPATGPVVELGAEHLVRERRRLRLLLATAGLLLCACLAVYGSRLRRETVELLIPPAELPGAIELIHVMQVGPMMYAQTSHWTWEGLGESERRKGVEALGLAALDRGFATLYLTDENGAQLAIWTRVEGTKLSAAPQP